MTTNKKTIRLFGKDYTPAMLRQEGEDAAIWHGRHTYAGKKAKEEFDALALELESATKPDGLEQLAAYKSAVYAQNPERWYTEEETRAMYQQKQ